MTDMERSRYEEAAHRLGRYSPEGWKECPFCGDRPSFVMKVERKGLLGTEWAMYMEHGDGTCLVDDRRIPEDMPVGELRTLWNTRYTEPAPAEPVWLVEK